MSPPDPETPEEAKEKPPASTQDKPQDQAKEKPAAPAKEKPPAPTKEKPAASAKEKPAAPPKEKPQAAAQEKPPAKEKPPAQAKEKPAAPAPDKPQAADKEKPSAPAKAAPKTAPKESEAAPPEFEKGLSDKIVARFGGKAEVRFLKPDRIGIRAAREDVKEVALYLRDELNFDHAESVSGVDYPEEKEIEVVYHLGSYTDDSLSRQVLELATRAPREDVPSPGKDSTTLPSLREVFYSVEFHERECFEMLGVYFEGHPDNRRLLLPEDWADLPPLRRDFAIKGR